MVFHTLLLESLSEGFVRAKGVKGVYVVKNVLRVSGIIVLAAVIGFMIACSGGGTGGGGNYGNNSNPVNPGGPATDGSNSATYVSYGGDDTMYELVIAKAVTGRAAYTPEAGDKYTLTITFTEGWVKSLGTVLSASGVNIVLTHSSGETVTVKLTGDGMYIESFGGNIPIDGGGKWPNPGTLIPAPEFSTTPAEFVSVTANGSSSPFVATTELTLTFDKAITGLAASHITLGTTPAGVTKGALSGSGPAYTLAISGTFISGALIVTVSNPTGFNITNSSKDVMVYGTGVATTGWGPWDENWRPATEITDGYRRRVMLNDVTFYYEVEFNGVYAFGTTGLSYEPIDSNGNVTSHSAAAAYRVRKGTAVPQNYENQSVWGAAGYRLGQKGIYIPAYHRERTVLGDDTTPWLAYKPVWEIGADNETGSQYAFEGVDLDVVSIPSLVRLIGESAFRGIANLKYVNTRTYGASANSDLVKIDNHAFRDCTAFEGFIYNAEIDAMGNIVIRQTDVYNLPYGLKEIGANAFYNCTAIKLIQIPETTTLVGDSAFYGWQVPQKIAIYKVGNEQQIAAAWNIPTLNSVWSRGIAQGKFLNGAQETEGTITYDRAAQNGYIVIYHLQLLTHFFSKSGRLP
jgi:hypothetical protein